MTKKDYRNYTREQLLAELNKLSKRKQYGLVWEEEKTKEKFEAESEGKLPVLTENKQKEIKTDATKPTNILIEGDNYHALSVLNYTHAKSIDVIYIDPPYNTGNNDFKYNDKFVDREDSYRHSKWISFMNKRLKLAKNLLKNTGVIFISIDDNEIAQLKLLCDEIFGSLNYVGQLIWRKKEGGGQTDKYFVTEHEYILVYQKSDSFEWLDKTVTDDISSFPKKDKKGSYKLVRLEKWGSGARREDRPTMYFPILGPTKTKIFPIAPDGNEGRWRVGKDTMDTIVENDLIHWEEKNNRQIPYEKVYYDRDKNKKIKARSILYELANTGDGTNQLTEIFNAKDKFPNPKPIELIHFCLKHTTKSNSIILDFFAGSGTTGHAVLGLNNYDDGNRQFILTTNNEGNICTEVCYPRVKKVIKGFKSTSKKETVKVEGLGGNLKYYKTNFVSSEPTHRNKKLLTEKSIEMLCIKENTFDEVLIKPDIAIFKSEKKFTAILFDELRMAEFKKELRKLRLPVSVYVFSLEGDDFSEDFEDLKSNITICSIPEAILKVYRRIYETAEQRNKK